VTIIFEKLQSLTKPNWFTLLILTIIITFTLNAFTFTSRAKIVPLVVSLPLLILSLLQVFTELFPDFTSKIKLFQLNNEDKLKIDISDEPKIINRFIEMDTLENPAGEARKRKYAVTSLLLMLALMWLFGLIIGGIIYISIYYRFIAGESWFRSIITSLLVGGIAYGLFGQLIKVNLWPGIIF
jgi:hypothetical protein